VGPVALLLAINLIELIPNATLMPLTWLLAGAVLGLGEQVRQVAGPVQRRPLGWKPLM
jgi:hypothetical protein